MLKHIRQFAMHSGTFYNRPIQVFQHVFDVLGLSELCGNDVRLLFQTTLRWNDRRGTDNHGRARLIERQHEFAEA